MMELLLEPSVEDFQTTKSRTIYPFQIFKKTISYIGIFLHECKRKQEV